MTVPALHPLEERFLRLSVVKKMITDAQVQRCQRILKDRLRGGEKNVGIEQILQEEGFLTDDESEFIWEIIASTGDKEVIQQIAERKGTEPGLAPEEKEEPGQVLRPRFVPTKEVPRRIAGYEVLEWIGRGGMGSVYRAHQVTMDRDVALKLLTPALASNARFIRRFIREARAAGRLNHGNLVRVYDVGESEGRYFISMEYVEGRTVKQILRRVGRMGVADSLKIIEQVSAALDCAHSFKIIHRDIKPDNIMIDTRGSAKLCDLGLAKELEAGPLQDTDTQDGQTMGTPHYMSPEQARAAGTVDARSDLYSLGATLYHMITGKVPFDGDTPIEVLMKVNSLPVPRPDRIDPLLPPPLNRLILRLLAKNPAERPSSAREVLREVRQLRMDVEEGRVFVLDESPRPKLGRPVTAPSGRFERQRNFWALGLGAAVIFLMAGLMLSRKNSGALPPLRVSGGPFFSEDGAGAKKEGQGTSLLDENKNQVATIPKARVDAVEPNPATLDMTAVVRRWDIRFDSDPNSWRRCLANVRDLEPKLGLMTAKSRARFLALKQKILVHRDQVVKSHLIHIQDGADALAQAGLFRRAAELVEDIQVEYLEAPGVKNAIAQASGKMRVASHRDARAQVKRLLAQAEVGLLRVAEAGLATWLKEIKRDGVPTNAERMTLVQEARAAVQAKVALKKAERNIRLGVLERIRRRMGSIREYSTVHRFAEALEECERLAGEAATDEERAAYNAERERLKIVRKFFAEIRNAVASNQKLIKDKDFIAGKRVSGIVTGLDEDQFHLAISGGRTQIPLKGVGRNEMRTFFQLVFFKHKFDKDDPLGRALYDLGDPNLRLRSAARVHLVDLARKFEAARTFLGVLLKYEEVLAREVCEQRLEEAEAAYLRQAPILCARTIAAAFSALGGHEDPVLEFRGQRLLELSGQARASRPFRNGKWSPGREGRGRLTLAAEDLALGVDTGFWSGASPRLRPEGGLSFGTVSSTANPPLTLKGPALFEAVFRVAGKGQATVALMATVADVGEGGKQETWSLLADRSERHLSIGLSASGENNPSQTKVPLRPDMDEIRLWLRLEVGYVAWGIGSKEMAVRSASPAPQWRVNLLVQGALVLDRIAMEGGLKEDDEDALNPKLIEEEWNGILKLARKGREAALKRFLREFGRDPGWASRAFIELAQVVRSAGRPEAARYYECRGLFECPRRLWPKEAPILYKRFRDEFQRIRSLYGPPFPDPRTGYPYEGFRLVSKTAGKGVFKNSERKDRIEDEDE